MHTYAQVDSLIYPLEELHARVSLEVPMAYQKEHSIRESADQHIATYSLTYYATEDNKPGGEPLDIHPVVESLAEDVMSQYDGIAYEIEHDERGRNTATTLVTVTWEKRQARFAQTPLKALPLTVYAQDDVYNIASAGGNYSILKNGEVLEEDLPSPAFALGAMVEYLRQALETIEVDEGLDGSPSHDFLAGAAAGIISAPDLPEAAKEHFVEFYELVTLKEYPE